MKRILFVGEHPQAVSGNSHMLNGIIDQLDLEKYEFAVFACTSIGCPVLSEYQLLEGGSNPYDEYGGKQLITFLDKNKFDMVCFVGLDIWCYSKVFLDLIKLKNRDGWKWVSIFPYDVISIQKDWLCLFSPIDAPCVYSEYGYNLLKDYVPNLIYFRPPLYDADKFVAFSKENKYLLRDKLFENRINKDTFIFGFFGNNQFRKDPLRLIKAIFEIKKDIPNIALYLHTNIKQGVYNIEQYIRDCGGQLGDVLVKKQNFPYSTKAMIEAYNVVDCLVNVSLQEGLSWTILEAMLCGVPVVASYNTAHIELLSDGAGIGVPSSEIAYVPMLCANGSSTFVESKACNYSSLVYAMKSIIINEDVRKNLKNKGLRKAKEWLEGVSSINDVFEKVDSCVIPVVKSREKINAVLFAQHSSAGDVFMTTRCFRDIKKRHPDIPLIYMTQSKYKNIIEDNPFIDEIIDWDETKLQNYKFVYNPHGERILPGHWGRNSNSILADFYWKVLMINKPDDFYIRLKQPKIKTIESIVELEKPIAILHTTGGDVAYRAYKYMNDVHNGILDNYFTIQVGGKDDYPAGAGLDLRGRLSFQETAWVVSKAKIAVTVDSFISHLAGAQGISQVVLFGSGNYNVVKPLQVRGTLICRVIDYVKHCRGLGPCSASVRDCPIHCTGLHSPKDILDDINYIEEKGFSSFEEMRISG